MSIFPPGDELSFDGQQQVVKTTLVNANTGTYRTNGYADVTFEGFENSLIANSPSGPGLRDARQQQRLREPRTFYDLIRATSGCKIPWLEDCPLPWRLGT
jgi:hypothetical protein